MSLLSTVLMAPFTASGLVAEGMVTGAVGRRVESAERVDLRLLLPALSLSSYGFGGSSYSLRSSRYS